jgi:hypothetical protein
LPINSQLFSTPRLSQYFFTTTSIASIKYNSILTASTNDCDTIIVNMFAYAAVALALFASAVSAQTNATSIDPNAVEINLRGE